MSGSPFIACSWRDNFLHHLIDHAIEATGNDLARACFIFPHSRPARYITEILKTDRRVRRPLIMPGMFAVSDLFSRLRAQASPEALWKAGMLDRVGLLLDVVRSRGALPGGGAFPTDDARFFYPWGLRLASLFEECLTHGKIPANLPHLEDQIAPFAARLLEELSAIFDGYVLGLEERGWTTPGLDAYMVVNALSQSGSLPGDLFRGKQIILAGFHALTGTEDTLFKYLWESLGATVLLHTDPDIIDQKQHWSCDELLRWAKRWKTRLVCAPPPASVPEADRQRPEIRFCEGFDLHSQLATLKDELAKTAPSPEHDADGLFAAHTAVVLPESGLLTPTLHHLPATDVNISMGYPLGRSSLFRLLDTIFSLQENKTEGGYHWRDVVGFIRHPYIKMLEPPLGEGAAGKNIAGENTDNSPRRTLRRELHALEQVIRQGENVHIRPDEVIEGLIEALPPARVTGAGVRGGQPPGEPGNKPDNKTDYSASDKADAPGAALSRESLSFIRSVFQTCLEGFATLLTPSDLALALEGASRLLLEHGGDLWLRFPIDAECLYRLLQSLIPELARSALSHEPLAKETLFSLARELMDKERVPFEASPLVGMQVMGMLESRLLTFRKVIVLETTEDLLPGSPPADPLLPESLRPSLGLPHTKNREQVAAYNFFRLLAGADEALLLWQEGGDAKGLEDKKKKKSRFVEELLWRHEQEYGKLFSHKSSEGPLTVLSCAISTMPKERRAILRTGGADSLMRNFLEGPISATALDAYVQCPARFFLTRLLGLDTEKEPEAAEGPKSIGIFFHNVLQDFYQERLGQNLPAGKDMPPSIFDELAETFAAHLAHEDLETRLPADVYAMLSASGKIRLERYLKGQPGTRVLSLEKKLTAPFEFFAMPGQRFTLTGTLDRLDMREGGPVIIDYKTGKSIPGINGKVWADTPFWERLSAWTPEQQNGADGPDPLLIELARHFDSVQLPLYMLLYSLSYNEDAANAAWVHLADDGREVSLFDKKMKDSELASTIALRIPELTGFILRHMSLCRNFTPQPGPHCDWCSVKASCMVSKIV